jgi:D-threo-aldose 1-dehydrogenase
MKATDRRLLGSTGMECTVLGFGTSPIGNLFRAIPEQEAQAMLDRAWDAGLRVFDTSPAYGNGLSELRMGHSLRKRPRKEFLLATKVGRLLKPTREPVDGGRCVDIPPFRLVLDYGYDAAMRSVEDSLQRLGTSHIDIALIHDVDTANFGPELQKVHFKTAMDGAFRALSDLRSQGVVGAVGLGVNEWQVCYDALGHGDFDCFLLAGRYTLLEQEPIEKFLPLCLERNVSLLIGGAFNGGILATGPVPGAKYNYKPAPEAIQERTARIKAVCDRYDVALPVIALQFPLGHPSVASVLLGTRTVSQLDLNIEWFETPVPADLWEELKREGLLHPEAPAPRLAPSGRTSWD